MVANKIITISLVLTALVMAWSSPTVADVTLDEVRKQLEMAAHLLEDSSAAKRVENSANADAQALREQARALFKQATDALDNGNGETAKDLLSKAKKTMFKAVRTAGSGGAKTDKAKHDYEKRALSIVALLKAQGRVVDEKHAKGVEARLSHQVETLLEDAGTFYQNGDYVSGKKTLDLAYEKVKLSIERMRTGETLVHKVVFNTIEDEYKYYSEKTKSQYDAITMATKSVTGTPREKSIKGFSVKMQDARKQAKELANKGDFEEAVKVLLPLFKSAPFRLMSLLQ